MRRLSNEAQIVFLYVLTCRDRRTEGLFELSAIRVAGDTNLRVTEVEAGFEELDRAGFVSYDADHEIVLDRFALHYSPLRPGRDKETGEIRVNRAMSAAVRHYQTLSDSPLKPAFVEAAKRYSPDLYSDLLEGGMGGGIQGGIEGGYPFARGGSREEKSRAEQSTSGEEQSREESGFGRETETNGSFRHTPNFGAVGGHYAHKDAP